MKKILNKENLKNFKSIERYLYKTKNIYERVQYSMNDEKLYFNRLDNDVIIIEFRCDCPYKEMKNLI